MNDWDKIEIQILMLVLIDGSCNFLEIRRAVLNLANETHSKGNSKILPLQEKVGKRMKPLKRTLLNTESTQCLRIHLISIWNVEPVLSSLYSQYVLGPKVVCYEAYD